MQRRLCRTIISGGMCEEQGGYSMQPTCLLLPHPTHFWGIIAHLNSIPKPQRAAGSPYSLLICSWKPWEKDELCLNVLTHVYVVATKPAHPQSWTDRKECVTPLQRSLQMSKDYYKFWNLPVFFKKSAIHTQ